MKRANVACAVVAAAVLLVTVACSERLPRAFGTSVAETELPDATAADATTDAEAVADAALDADLADAGDAGADTDAEATPDADAAGSGACNVRLAAPAVEASPHVAEGSAVTYTSNPPASGPHYPVWANFQEFTHPVEDGYLVHALEHGAVLLLYKCADDGGTCADTVAQLRAVRDAIPTDPLCAPGIRVRVIIAPRAANDTAISASAWGNTYRADCVDAASLTAFVNAHYAKAPEDFCNAGGIF